MPTALKSDGTITAWGNSASGQTNVPSGLSNVMGIASGYSHSVALKNDGTMVVWGDNSAGQTNVPGFLSNLKLIAAGGNQTAASMFSPLLQYPVDVSKDLLLVYNTNSADSAFVKTYYLAHRPMVSNANILGIGCPATETIFPSDFTNAIASPIETWLSSNPTKRPQYMILFLDVPSRVNSLTTNGYGDPGQLPSVSYQLHLAFEGWRPFVTHMNMNGTNDCVGYINKLANFGTNYSAGNIIIGAGAYGNTNYYLDDGGNSPLYFTNGILGLTNNGIPTSAISYFPPGTNHPYLCTNVAGFATHGFHGGLGAFYSTDGTIHFFGNSSWYIIETRESFNGQRMQTTMGKFVDWYSINAFGGADFSNTPIGAVTHVDEPGSGINLPSAYFGLWAAGKNFGICAWNSRSTPYFQAVGDPLVSR